MEENVDKTLRAYADGSLSGEALEAFERQLEQDPDLRSELDLYLALKAMDNLRLKKQLQQIEVAEDVSSPAPFITRRRMLWTAAAASVALSWPPSGGCAKHPARMRHNWRKSILQSPTRRPSLPWAMTLPSRMRRNRRF